MEVARFIGLRSSVLKLFISLWLSSVLAVVAAAQSTPPGAKVAAAKPADTKAAATKTAAQKKEEARRKFVLDTVQSAVALPEADPQDRLRLLTEAVDVVAPIDQKLAQQLIKEGTVIETKLLAEGQKPAASMLAGGHVDCATATTFVQSLPASALVDAESSLIAAITSCPKQVDEAAKSKLEAGVSEGVVAARPILAIMSNEGMNSPWSQAMFVRMFSSLPGDMTKNAQEASNYAAMFAQLAPQMDKDSVKTAGTKLLYWLSGVPDAAQRSTAVSITTGTLSEVLGAADYEDLLRSDATLQQAANNTNPNALLAPPTPPEEENVSVLRAMDETGDRTGALRSMSAATRAREAAASGFASGTKGDRKMADHYFDIAFAAVDEVWAQREDAGANAPEVVQEVSDAAAQVDPVAALQRTQKLQDPSAEAIGMLSVARVVMSRP